MATTNPTPNVDPNQGMTAGMTFDAAPVSQATPASALSAPAPSTNGNSDASAGMTFDAKPVTAPLTVPATANQPTQGTGVPHGTIRATPQPTGVAANVEQWAENVKNDLLNGTGNTKVGQLLKFLGAPGLGKGVSPEVANFMGGELTGPARMLQGQAEMSQPGKRWQGVKNYVGGGLDTSNLPGSIAIPDVSELGTEAAIDAAGRAAKAAKGTVSVKALQPKVQGAIASAMHAAAAEHGITIPEGTNIRDVTQTVSNALRAKAHDMYASLDTALGGTRFQSFEDAIDNVQRAIRDEVGLDPQRDKQLSERLADAKAARDTAIEQVRANGIDPTTIDQADALHRRAMALQDVSKAVRASTDVHPSQVASGADNTAATNVRTKPLFTKLQQLATPNPKYPGTPARLVQALGEDRAAQLLHDVDAAHLAAQKIAARNAWIKRGATAAGLYGIGHEVFSGLHGLLSEGQ